MRTGAAVAEAAMAVDAAALVAGAATVTNAKARSVPVSGWGRFVYAWPPATLRDNSSTIAQGLMNRLFGDVMAHWLRRCAVISLVCGQTRTKSRQRR